MSEKKKTTAHKSTDAKIAQVLPIWYALLQSGQTALASELLTVEFGGEATADETLAAYQRAIDTLRSTGTAHAGEVDRVAKEVGIDTEDD